MPSSWSESNRLHSSNMREDAADSQLEDYTSEELEAEEEARRLEEEYDAYEAAQLQRLDEIHDGDWNRYEREDRYLDAAYEDRYYEPELDFDIY